MKLGAIYRENDPRGVRFVRVQAFRDEAGAIHSIGPRPRRDFVTVRTVTERGTPYRWSHDTYIGAWRFAKAFTLVREA